MRFWFLTLLTAFGSLAFANGERCVDDMGCAPLEQCLNGFCVGPTQRVLPAKLTVSGHNNERQYCEVIFSPLNLSSRDHSPIILTEQLDNDKNGKPTGLATFHLQTRTSVNFGGDMSNFLKEQSFNVDNAYIVNPNRGDQPIFRIDHDVNSYPDDMWINRNHVVELQFGLDGQPVIYREKVIRTDKKRESCGPCDSMNDWNCGCPDGWYWKDLGTSVEFNESCDFSPLNL